MFSVSVGVDYKSQGLAVNLLGCQMDPKAS